MPAARWRSWALTEMAHTKPASAYIHTRATLPNRRIQSPGVGPLGYSTRIGRRRQIVRYRTITSALALRTLSFYHSGTIYAGLRDGWLRLRPVYHRGRFRRG